MEADKQRGSIVLTKQNIDGQDYIRIDYGNNQAIAGKSSVRCPLKPSDSIPLCPNNPAH